MQVWSVNSLGGYMWSENLSNVLRMSVQPLVKFRQYADIKDAAVQGKGKGDTFHWNVYKDVADQGTRLTETNTMAKTNFKIVQGTMTIYEMGNSVDYTGKLDDLSEQPVKEIINKVLRNDAKKAFDIEAEACFSGAPLRVVPTAGTNTSAVTLTTNGTATLTNNVAMTKEHVKTIIDTMKERNIPPYDGNDYRCLARVSTFRKFKNDLEDLHKYVESGFAMLENGAIGRYESCQFVEQTNIGSRAWSNGLSDRAYFFGNDTVAEGIVVPEEMRGKIPGDYGRDKGIAWYYLGGFALVHQLDTTDNSKNARVVVWDSAA